MMDTIEKLSDESLVACDQSYKADIATGTLLSPYHDGGDIPYVTTMPEQFEEAIDGWSVDYRKDEQQTGFGATVYKRSNADGTTDYMVALQGTRGPNIQDWYGNVGFGVDKWRSTGGGQALVEYLKNLLAAGDITGNVYFTGQSLGGALAEYAAYDFRINANFLAKTNPALAISNSRLALVTFNGLGGIAGLQSVYGSGFDPNLLAGSTTRHYWVTGDIVNRLGAGTGALANQNHLNGSGNEYRLDYFQVDHSAGGSSDWAKLPDGSNKWLSPVDAHRIETGFYAGINTAGTQWSAHRDPIKPLQITDLAKSSVGFVASFNNANYSAQDGEATARLIASLTYAASIGSESDLAELLRAAADSLYHAGQISKLKYDLLTTSFPTMFQELAKTPAGAKTMVRAMVLASFLDSLEASPQLSQATADQVAQAINLFNGNDYPSVASNPYLQAAGTFLSTKFSQWTGESDEKFRVVVAVAGRIASDTVADPDSYTAVRQVIDNHLEELLDLYFDPDNGWEKFVLKVASYEAQLPLAGLDAIKRYGDLIGWVTDNLVTAAKAVGAKASVLAELVSEVTNGANSIAKGFANSIPDFSAKFSGIDLTFPEIDAFTTQEQTTQKLLDRLKFLTKEVVGFLTGSGDAIAAEQAHQTLDQAVADVTGAAQSVAIREGTGPNPFDDPNFDPDSAPPATGSLGRGNVETLTVYLPFAVGTGGQKIHLQLTGSGVDAFDVLANAQLVPLAADGGFDLNVAEGDKSVTISLMAVHDLASDATLGLSATLEDASGNATHQTRLDFNLGVQATVHDAGTPSHTIIGDLQPVYSDGSVVQEPSQYRYDGLGNVITDPQQPAPGRDDKLRDSDGDDLIKAGEGNNSISATQGGNDTIVAGSGNDTIYGLFGNESISGGGGSDVIITGSGNSHIYANTAVDIATALDPEKQGSATGGKGSFLAALDGNNTIVGGSGNDAVVVGSGDNLIILGPGNDSVVAGVAFRKMPDGWSTHVDSEGHTVVFDGVEMKSCPYDAPASFQGTTFDGVPVGGGNDTIFGGRGNSYIWGSNGSNYIDAGGGNDSIYGGNGDDTIFSGSGDCLIFGNGGDDYIDGESGNSTLVGGRGNNTIYGGTGNDKIYAGNNGDHWWDSATGDNYVEAGDGNTLVCGAGGHDTLIGGKGKDTLLAGDGTEYIEAGSGDTLIYGGSGENTIVAGEGKDTIYAGEGATTIYGGTGTDLIYGGSGENVIYAGDGGTAEAPTQVVAGSGDTTIYGGSGYDVLKGGSGQTLIYAGDGGTAEQPTQVIAGSGDTTIYGGLGDVRMDATKASSADLVGGEGHCMLLGGNGDDTLVAGSGDTLMDGGNGNNIFEVAGDSGAVEIQNAHRGDTLRFGAGISANDLTLSAGSGHNGGSAIVIDCENGNTITLDGQDDSSGLDQFEFADGGMTLSYEQLLAQANWDQPQQPDLATSESRFLGKSEATVISQLQSEGLVAQTDGTWYGVPALSSLPGAVYSVTTTTVTWSTATSSTTSTGTSDDWRIGGYYGYQPPSLADIVVTLQQGTVEADDATINAGTTLSSTSTAAGLAVNWTVSSTPYDTGSYNFTANGYFYTDGTFGFSSRAGATAATYTSRSTTAYYLASATPVLVNGTFALQADPGIAQTTSGSGALPCALSILDTHNYSAESVQRIDVGAGDHIVNASRYNVVNAGSGNNTINNAGFVYTDSGNDIVNNAGVVYCGSGNNLIDGAHTVYAGSGSDTIFGADTVYGGSGNAAIDESWVVFAGSGNNFIAYSGEVYGGSGNDTVIGGIGTDMVVAGAGNDLIMNSGGIFDVVINPTTVGHVVIDGRISDGRSVFNALCPPEEVSEWYEMQRDSQPAMTVKFGAGVSLSNLTLSWGQTTLPSGNTDASAPTYQTVDLSWGTGQQVDLVVPGAGDPADAGVIQEVNFADRSYLTINGQPSVHFAADLTSSDVTVSRDGTDLLLSSQSGGNGLRLQGWYANPLSMPTLNAIFADGVTWNAATLTRDGLTVDGSAGNQTLVGLPGFSNVLIGGANDTLIGGSGNDTFELKAGTGTVQIVPVGQNDTLSFSNWLGDTDVQCFRQGADLRLVYGWEHDVAVIQDFFTAGTPLNLAFSDGSTGTLSASDSGTTALERTWNPYFSMVAAFNADGSGTATETYVESSDEVITYGITYQGNGSYDKVWADRNGNQNTESYNAVDQSYGGKNYSYDGSYYYIYTQAANGDYSEVGYDAAGAKSWDYSERASDGFWSEDNFYPDGTFDGDSHNADGSYATWVNDGHGTLTTQYYDASDTLLGSSVTIDDGQGDVTTTHFDASGNQQSDTWQRTDGSHGSDTFNLDGSSSGTAYHPDGSYYTYTDDGLGGYHRLDYDASGHLVVPDITVVSDDGQGDVTTTVYDASGHKLSDQWVQANGTSGSDVFNPDGSVESQVTYLYADGSTYAFDTVTQADGSYQQNWTQSDGSHGTNNYVAATGETSGTSYTAGSGYLYSWDNTHLADGSSESKVAYAYDSGLVTSYDTVSQADGSYQQSWTQSGGSYGTNAYVAATGETSGTNYTAGSGYLYSWDNTHLADGASESKVSYAYDSGLTTSYDTVSQADGSYQQSWTQSGGSYGTNAYVAATGEISGTSYSAGSGYLYSWDNTHLADGASESKVSYAYDSGSTTSYDTVTQTDGSYQQSWTQSGGSHGTNTYVAATGETSGTSYTAGSGYLYSWDNTHLADGASESKVSYAYDSGLTTSYDTVTQTDGSYQQSWAQSGGSYGTNAYVAATGETSGTSYTAGSGYLYSWDNTHLADGSSESKVAYAYDSGLVTSYDTVSLSDGSYQQGWTQSGGSYGTNNYVAPTGEVSGTNYTAGNGYLYSWDNTKLADGSAESKVSYAYDSGAVTSYDTVTQTDGSYQQSWAQSGGSYGTNAYVAATGETSGTNYTAGSGYLYSWDNTHLADGASESKVAYAYDTGSTTSYDTVTQVDGSYQQSWNQTGGSYGTNAYVAATGEVSGSSYSAGSGYLYSWDNTHLAGGVSESKVSYAYDSGTVTSYDTVSQADGSYQQSWNQTGGSHGTNAYVAATGEVSGSSYTAGSGYLYSWDNTHLADGASESRVSYACDSGSTTSYDTVTQADGSYQQSWTSSTGTAGSVRVDASGAVVGSSWRQADGAQGVDAGGNALRLGAAQDDSLWGGAGSTLVIGGAGNDTLRLGSGTNLLAFNRGDGRDTVDANAGLNNALSLGGLVTYDDLAFQKNGNDLVLDVGGQDAIDFQDWYVSPDHQKLVTLQVIEAAAADYAPGSGDGLRNAQVESFDFQQLVAAFDQARGANSGLTAWNLTQALLDTHLAGSDSAALGGSLAYEYGMQGNLSGFNIAAAEDTLANRQFAAAPQTLQPASAVVGGVAQLR